MTTRGVLAQRFKKLYPGARLLAVQLDGFSHRVVFDAGAGAPTVQWEVFSGCMPENPGPGRACALFAGIGHSGYQNNAKEIIFLLPEER